MTHSKDLTAAGESGGAWFFRAPGSGIWFNVGKTKAYKEHGNAAMDLCHNPFAPFGSLGNCAKKAGLDSIQFIDHSDPEWDCGFGSPLDIEIVGAHLDGRYACTSTSGTGVFKAGWDASQDCHCDNSLDRLNCKISPGYPPNY